MADGYAPDIEALRIIDYALHLRMYGERAPGGDETWRDWDLMAESFLRREICRKNGHDYSDDPGVCSTCGAIYLVRRTDASDERAS